MTHLMQAAEESFLDIHFSADYPLASKLAFHHQDLPLQRGLNSNGGICLDILKISGVLF
jgi:ubiquitin-protein ligase